MVSLMELSHEHDVTDLAVLVRLCAVKPTVVDHRHRLFHSSLQALKFPDVRNRWDHAAHLLVVDARRDRAEDDASSRLHGALLQVFKQEIAEEEVPEVVRGEAQLVPVGRPPWPTTWKESREEGSLFVSIGEVHCGIAHQCIQRNVQCPESGDKLADTVVRCKVQVHDHVAALRKVLLFGNALRLHKISAGHDHAPFAGLGQLSRCGEAEP
mmetsp:Transcript_55060/g.103195  ORF Transcript_55060/g.103195 Transcript_55060/m.103195 type:complete len:211 (+) Transcript_55060:554-1186(+)